MIVQCYLAQVKAPTGLGPSSVHSLRAKNPWLKSRMEESACDCSGSLLQDLRQNMVPLPGSVPSKTEKPAHPRVLLHTAATWRRLVKLQQWMDAPWESWRRCST